LTGKNLKDPRKGGVRGRPAEKRSKGGGGTGERKIRTQKDLQTDRRAAKEIRAAKYNFKVTGPEKKGGLLYCGFLGFAFERAEEWSRKKENCRTSGRAGHKSYHARKHSEKENDKWPRSGHNSKTQETTNP